LRYLNSEQSSTAVDGPNSVGSRASEATTWLDIEFRVPRVLNDDAREALLFLTRPASPTRLRAGRGVRWVEPRLIATVKHFGRTATGALRAGVLQALDVI